MLSIYDQAGTLLSLVTEFDSLIATQRFGEHSEWTGRFSESAWAKLNDPAAYFCRVEKSAEVYLIEAPAMAADLKVTCSGRSASTLLETRTITQVYNFSSQTAGQIMATLFLHLGVTGRTLPLIMGTNATTGAITMQRSWGDMSKVLLEVCAASGAGFRTRFDATGKVVLDMMMPADSGRFLGEQYNAESSSGRVIPGDKQGWYNFAYVLGEGEGSERVVVTVDQRAGAERRELYVDARDLQRGDLTLAQYESVLYQRGVEKLAEHRRLDYVEVAEMMTETRRWVITPETLWSEDFSSLANLQTIIGYNGWTSSGPVLSAQKNTAYGTGLARMETNGANGIVQRTGMSLAQDSEIELTFRWLSPSSAAFAMFHLLRATNTPFLSIAQQGNTLQHSTDGVSWLSLIGSFPAGTIHTLKLRWKAGETAVKLTWNGADYSVPVCAAITGTFEGMRFEMLTSSSCYFGSFVLARDIARWQDRPIWQPGDVATYGGKYFQGSLLVTAIDEIHEDGRVTRMVSLGPPPPQSLAAALKRPTSIYPAR